MTDTPPEIVVVVEDHVTTVSVSIEETPEISVSIEETPAISVSLSELGLTGPRGAEGPPGDSSGPLLDEHVNAAMPHPAYDDGPSFALLYENAKV